MSYIFYISGIDVSVSLSCQVSVSEYVLRKSLASIWSPYSLNISYFPEVNSNSYCLDLKVS